MGILTKSQVDLFHEKGFLKIPKVLEEKYALKIQEEIWNELEEAFSIKQHVPQTWKTPKYSPRKTKFSPINEQLINDNFRTIINELIGENTWKEPSNWGGFLVNFSEKVPKEWNLANKLWHWDNELFRTPELNGLLIFSFYSEVEPRGGGTLVVSGSHRAIRQYRNKLTPIELKWKHGAHRKHFMQTHPYFKKLTDPNLKNIDHIAWFMEEEKIVERVPLRVVELTGQPGDVVFCHPRLVHAPANINLNDYPRMMRTKFLW